MKKTVRMLSVASIMALLMSSVPIYAGAVDDSARVRVIVENATLSKENGAGWDGILFDSTVTADSNDNALTVFAKAVEENALTQSGADMGFVTEINGLGGEQGGAWMATLNDWFTDEALSAYTVENGKLSDGDEIHFMYTMNWGADLGYDWTATDTTLTSLQFSSGTLTPDFDPSVTEYTLTLSEDTVSVVPTAASKSFPVKIYKNDYTADQLKTDYKKNTEIAVSDEDTIIIGIANHAWMSYIPDGVTETVYTVGINHTAKEISVEPSQEEVSEPSDKNWLTVDELREKYPVQQAVYGNEWGMITLAKFGLLTDETTSSYMASVKDYLDSIGTAKISNTRSTSVSGVALALSGMYRNVYDFNGYNLLEPLSDMDYVVNQGINGAIYALMALDTNAQYYIPRAQSGVNQTTREKLIAAVLEAQGNDGGWTFDVGNASDADMTGMALQALAPYKNREDVRPAIDKALVFLSESQKDNGGYVSYGAEDSESCSQVMAALAMLDIDIFSDSRFIKNNYTVFDALMRYYIESDSTFAHTMNGESNTISTSQAYYAVSSVYMYQHGGMTDKPVFEEPETSTDMEYSEPSKEVSDNPSVVSESPVSSHPQQSDTVSQTTNTVSQTPSADTVPTGDTQNSIWIFGALLISVSVILAVSKKKI